MKLSNYLVEIKGVSIYPIISLGIFVVFFAIVLYRTLKMSKVEVSETASLPIDID